MGSFPLGAVGGRIQNGVTAVGWIQEDAEMSLVLTHIQEGRHRAPLVLWFQGHGFRLALVTTALPSLWVLGGQRPQAWQEVTLLFFMMPAAWACERSGHMAPVSAMALPPRAAAPSGPASVSPMVKRECQCSCIFHEA